MPLEQQKGVVQNALEAKEGILKLSQGILEAFPGCITCMETHRIHSQAMGAGRDEVFHAVRKWLSKGSKKIESTRHLGDL